MIVTIKLLWIKRINFAKSKLRREGKNLMKNMGKSKLLVLFQISLNLRVLKLQKNKIRKNDLAFQI